jgi:nitroimidazol reductase NimA-like FMN-containing flavoprotein (pyridoxamine 5'-phosphate oxidase superfamily)
VIAPRKATRSRTLTDAECVERLFGASVGRVAFVTPLGLQIIPVSVRATGTSLMLDTTPQSSLSQLAEMGGEVTLEVDEAVASSGQAWSVLMRGPILKLDPQGRKRREAMSQQVDPWPGDACTQSLEFTPRSYSGRLVEHPVPSGVTPTPQRGTAASGTTS